MHEPIRDDLDAAIDRTGREMLAVDPDPTFDARVRAAVPRRSPLAWPWLAAAAACAVVAAIVFPGGGIRWFGPTANPDAPHMVGGGIEVTRTAPPVPDPPDPTVAAGTSPRVRTAAPHRDRTRAAPRPERQHQNARQDARAAASPGANGFARLEPAVPIAGAEPLPGVAPLPTIEPLTIASLPREAVSLQARLIAPLEPIAAIEIAPLSPSEWRE